MAHLRKVVFPVAATYFALFFAIECLKAQPRDWGDIDRQILEKKVHQADSSTVAVVLFDDGYLRVEDDLQYFLDRHVRIKLFRPEGYKWATVNLDYNEKYDQEITDLEAATYVINSNGELKRYEVEKDSYFEEVIIDEWRRISFTFPSLIPGAIIEYRYTKKIGNPAYLPVWYFDWLIPTQWNRLVAEFPSFLNFTKVFSGDQDLDINDWKEFNKTIRFSHKTKDRSLYSMARGNRAKSSVNFNGERFTWVMKNRDAIPELPFMRNRNNYRAHVRIQLSELNIPNEVQKNYLKTWDDVVTELLNDEEFSSFISTSDTYEEIYTSHQLQGKSNQEILRILFDFVSTSFVTDEPYGLYDEQPVDEVLDSRKGSGTEKNLLLTGLLRQAGFRAQPILISTRDHGQVFDKYVLPNQFNHAIVLVEIDDHEVLLDAGNGKRPLYLLPDNDINGKGLMVKRNVEEWVPLLPLQKTMRASAFQAKINPDGSLNGRASGVSTGYFAFSDRKYLKNNGQEEFLRETFFKDFISYNLSRPDISNLANMDTTLHYQTLFFESALKNTQKTDSTIYLDAIPIMKWEDNPLKQEDRGYPVELEYPYREQLTVIYEIPSGFQIEEHPEKLITRIAKKGGMFSRTVRLQEKRIIVKSHIDLARSRYAVDEYDRLKLFFDQIIEAHSEKIILKKDD